MWLLKEGRRAIPHEEMYALFELLHALRDNLQIDLREAAPKYFTELPAWHLLSHYPATFPAAENEYRIPAFAGVRPPFLRLHDTQQVTMFSQSLRPPCATGTT